MCMIDDADGRWDTLRLGMVIARKDYQCAECRRPIVRGERHESGVFKGDYGLDAFRTCAHCVWARGWLLVQCNGFCYSGVLEDLREHWEENWELRSRDLLHRINGMRHRWTRRGQLVPIPA